jgi:hypothetical protein
MRRAIDQLTAFIGDRLDLNKSPWDRIPQSIGLRVSNAVILLCVVYLWLRPVSNNFVLVPVLFMMGLGSAAACVFGVRRLAAGFAPIWLCQVFLALLGTVVGAIGGAPGLLYGVLIYAAAPILYWTWVRAFDLGTIRQTLFWLFISTSVLSTIIILFVAGETRLIPQVVPASLLDASGAAFAPAGNTPGQIRFYGLSTLAAAGPLCAASLFVRADKLMPNAKLRAYAAASSTVAALVSGRRAIVLVIVLAPLAAWMCSAVIRSQWGSRQVRGRVRLALGAALRRRGKLALAVGASLLFIGVAYVTAPLFIPFSAISYSLASAQAMVFGGGAGVADVRVAEAKALIDGWLKSPLVGNGFGAILPNYSRDPARPWNFELQYHVILFQTGLTGVSLGIVALLAALRQLRATARAVPAYSATLVVTTTGAVSLLLANSVDPYLQAPGHMWAIYLPLAVANSVLIAHMKSTHDKAVSTGEAELKVP